jgi:hypothetical protein
MSLAQKILPQTPEHLRKVRILMIALSFVNLALIAAVLIDFYTRIKMDFHWSNLIVIVPSMTLFNAYIASIHSSSRNYTIPKGVRLIGFLIPTGILLYFGIQSTINMTDFRLIENDGCEYQSCALLTSHYCAMTIVGVFALYEMAVSFLFAYSAPIISQ